MSRYIDAEWLSELFPDTGDGDWTYNATALGYINSAPSIDIVICKDCKWAKANGTYQWCGRLDSTARITADDFCSRGESKAK